MKFRFSVTGFVDRKTRFGVVGSTPELGFWEAHACVPLLPLYVNKDELEPSTWSGVVTIDTKCLQYTVTSDIQYKFIRWQVLESIPETDQKLSCYENDLAFPLPCSPMHMKFLSPDITAEVVWEGHGKQDNRVIKFNKEAKPKNYAVSPHSLLHIYDPDEDLMEGDVYTLPVYLFMDPDVCRLTEASHTTRSYLRIKNSLRIHYNRVLNRVLIGTCPRTKEHLMFLKTNEKVSDILNLQTVDDIVDNFLISDTCENKTPESVMDYCNSLGFRYVWYQIEDMSSDARARGAAQAVLLLTFLLTRKDCSGVYVHCNAGVGRSVSCVAGYIHCILGASVRLTNILINSRRPVAFFDEQALKASAKDFNFKFGDIRQMLKINSTQ